MTIAQALDVRERSLSFREAEIFLQDILAVERTYLHTHPNQILTGSQASQFDHYLARREQNEPVAYILGRREFYGRSFLCDKRALIPRPETEGMIDLALAWLPSHFQEKLKRSNKPCPLRILELGTGCGNIAITLANELNARAVPATILATDISSEAISLASENWQTLKTEGYARIRFLEADLFQNEQIQKAAPFDLIIANLPYVPTAWQFDPLAQPDVVFHEPDTALFGGSDGLAIYRRFFQEAGLFVAPPAKIIIEFGEGETTPITALAQTAFGQAPLKVHQDYAQLDRILEISF